MPATDRAAQEAAFRRAGLPLFSDEFRGAERGVWSRALPLLTPVFFAEVLGAVDLDFTLLENAGTLLAGLAILVGSFALINRLRGRAPLQPPDTVGRVELAAFVVVPASLPLVLNGQLASAIATAAANLVLLASLYAASAFGLVFIVAWAGRRLVGQLAVSLQLAVRAVPLLLLFSVVLFINTEMWQVFADMGDGTLAASALMLGAVGTVFLVVRLPREVATLERQVGSGPPLDPRQRLNVGLVMFVSQALQVVVVSLSIGLFFLAFGAVAISDHVVEQWIGHGRHVVVDLGGIGIDVQVSRELLRVAAAIASLSGLYYAIAVLTDGTYREEFLTELTAEMRSSFELRAEYLRA